MTNNMNPPVLMGSHHSLSMTSTPRPVHAPGLQVSRRAVCGAPVLGAVSVSWPRGRALAAQGLDAGADEVLVVRPPPAASPSSLTAGFAAGYGVPAGQYASYGEALAWRGWTCVIWSDAGRRGASGPGVDAAASARFAAAVVAEGGGGGRGGVALLAGHSRGAKLAALAAQRWDPAWGDVPGVCLLDPVDGSDFAPAVGVDSALEGPLEERGSPGPSRGSRGPLYANTLIVGTSAGGECAPAGLNWAAFGAAMPGSEVRRLEGAGHLQLVDDRAALGILDVCPVARPPVDDADVRGAARAALLDWAARQEAARR